jgi:hypothetical protein
LLALPSSREGGFVDLVGKTARNDLGGKFGTTRFALEAALKMHKEKPLSGQLEIETYTWDVLPDHLKTGDIVDYVCREIEWVRGQLV